MPTREAFSPGTVGRASRTEGWSAPLGASVEADVSGLILGGGIFTGEVVVDLGTGPVALEVDQPVQLRTLQQQLAAIEERQKLARELHDSVSQALYGIALGARTARTQLDRDPRGRNAH